MKLTRRDLLKLLLLGPLLEVEWEQLANQPLKRPQKQENQNRPNVLLLVFDTFSAPHASFYRYFRETTPNLARFAEHATVFHQHYSAGNFTSPGTASLLTGTYPWTHRAFNIKSTIDERMLQNNLFSAFDGSVYYRTAYTHSSLATIFLNQFSNDIEFLKPLVDLFLSNDVLADQLFPNDLNTATFSEELILPRDGRLPTSLFASLLNESRELVQERRLLEKYGEFFPRGLPSADEEGRVFILEDAIDWLIEQTNNVREPYLLYAHLLPPHEPYRPRIEFTDLFNDEWLPVAKPQHFSGEGLAQAALNQRRRTYDHYLAYVDAEFGRLYNTMLENGTLDNTYVVVTSDHGQMFERGIHGHITPTLYNPVLQIPLIISKPGQQQRVDVRTPTSAVDVVPSLLTATSHPFPAWTEGRLLPTFSEEAEVPDRPIYAMDAKRNFRDEALTVGTMTLIKGPYKLIHYLGYDEYEDSFELYNLEQEREEIQDLYESEPAIAAELREEMEAKIAEVNEPYL
jgi:arylsulfatase A-like enzyme